VPGKEEAPKSEMIALDENQDEEEEKQQIEEEVEEKPQCRFCWGDENTLENPLLSSCKCSGGVRFIHFLCLRQWLKTK